MKQVFFILGILLTTLLSACEEQSIIKDDGNNNGNGGQFYRIEKEPKLSPDRSELVLIRADTVVTSENGIYRAGVGNPIRYAVYLVENLHSPTLSLSKDTIAFLKGQKIHYIPANGGTETISTFTQSFDKIIYFDDNILIGNQASTIYHISETRQEIINVIDGFCPTVYTKDTVAFIRSLQNNRYSINLLNIHNVEPLPNTPLDLVVIDTLFSLARPLSFGIEPQSRRYCFSSFQVSGYEVFAKESGSLNIRKITKSKYRWVEMVDYNTVIFTGEDGRLYRTDFAGNIAIPFWGAEDSK